MNKFSPMILGLPSSFLRDARRAFNYKPIAERSGTTVGRPLTDEEIIQLVEHKPNRAKAEILARAHQRERDERERAQAGIIQFKDEINQDSAASLIAQLDDIITDKVVLRIASQGGFVGDAFKIVNALKALRARGVTLETYAEHNCSSSAVMLLACGSKRGAHPDTQICMHCCFLDGTDLKELNAPILAEAAARFAADDARIKSFLASSGVKLSAAQLRKYDNGEDLFLSVEDACRAGLIGYIANGPV